MFKSVIQIDNSKCFVCGKGGELHPHHIFNGAFKKKSEEDGYIIYVHNIPCHQQIHSVSGEAMYYKKYAQKHYEKTHTREEFLERYKKNYLWNY